MVNTILKEADLFCPNSVRINFTIYLIPIIRDRIIHLLNGRHD
ncbi:ABC transporter ATP-binding protein [Lactiplantibacillus plantarum]|nr:ABC transporter ATP-binding protein [Lactiplantibacillus plantarum]